LLIAPYELPESHRQLVYEIAWPIFVKLGMERGDDAPRRWRDGIAHLSPTFARASHEGFWYH
jgi:hypothetical protein